MSLDKIEKHILEQARQEADVLLENARKERSERLAEVQEREKETLEQQVKGLEHSLERERQQATAKERARQRAEILRMKTDIIDGVFRDAKEKSLGSAAYREWLKKRLLEMDVKEGDILCREADRQMMAELLKEVGLEGLGVAGEGQAPTGGFLARTGKYELDVTLDGELAGLREELVGELAQALDQKQSK